jgi:hypothetical protein
MTKEELEKFLIDDRIRTFVVLDGASVPELPMRLYEMRPPNYCLFRGELEPDMAEVAPYVVQLVPNSTFTDWVLAGENFGKHWGIFVHTLHSIKEMRRHFRGLVTVYNEKGAPMIFRFYDPRVLRKFLPTCMGDELTTFFGKVNTIFAEDEKGEKFSAFKLENDQLKQTDLN